MTFTGLVEELEACGFQYVAKNRLEDWIQRSYAQLSARHQWPWLEWTEEQAAPFEFKNKDLRYVLSVLDTTQERTLWGVERTWARERFPNLEEAGSPVYWFLENQEKFRTFPTSEDKIAVRYIKKAAQIAGTEEPLIPSEWQYLIVDTARVLALRDNDEWQNARELKGDVEAGVNEMIADQLHRNWQTDRTITRGGLFYDYL